MLTPPGFTSADYKVPGGKLLRVRLQVEAHRIKAIRLTGDFFMHPEHALEALEAGLTDVVCEEHALRTQIQAFFETDVQVIGADVEDFVKVIMLSS